MHDAARMFPVLFAGSDRAHIGPATPWTGSSRTPTTGSYADFVAPATGDANRSVGDAVGQLQPLVLPQPSQTKQLPAGRIFVPQFMQSGASADVPMIDSTSSVELCAVGGASCAVSTTISSCSWLANAEPV